eukprot:2634639-Amphidinium_carterae.1
MELCPIHGDKTKILPEHKFSTGGSCLLHCPNMKLSNISRYLSGSGKLYSAPYASGRKFTLSDLPGSPFYDLPVAQKRNFESHSIAILLSDYCLNCRRN